jgi:hypothetical protein
LSKTSRDKVIKTQAHRQVLAAGAYEKKENNQQSNNKMTEPTRTGTGRSPKPSDGYTRKFKDRKKSKDEPMVGAMETFGSLIYKINSKDAAEMYHATTEAIVDYVTITYGKDMQNLVKYGVDRNLTMPSPPPEA